ncbi:MAG: hypothetical protein AAGJ35_13740, partial [Myxococcota bacterium]
MRRTFFPPEFSEDNCTSTEDFLAPYLIQYGDQPLRCGTDAQNTKICGICGICQEQACAEKPILLHEAVCQPCVNDQDCSGGACLLTSEGKRCAPTISAGGCCPPGHSKKEYTSTQGQRIVVCVPRQPCESVPCTQDQDCGPSETCINKVCVFESPLQNNTSCRPCKNSKDCGPQGFCHLATSMFGYCQQRCNQGICPKGFTCEQPYPGIRVCTPIQFCQVQCTQDPDCSTGERCISQQCVPQNGGSLGAFCSQALPCARPLRCLRNTDDVIGRCFPPCGPALGKAGSPCNSNNTCDTGLRCFRFSSGQSICLEACTDTCQQGGRCSEFTRSSSACLCGQDSQCGTGKVCNTLIGRSAGFGACTPKPPN